METWESFFDTKCLGIVRIRDSQYVYTPFLQD